MASLVTTVCRCLIALAFITVSASATAFTLDESANQERIDLSDTVEILEDPLGTFTLQDVQSAAISSRFAPPVGAGHINLGITQSAWWFRVSLSRRSGSTSQWIIEVPEAYLQHLTLYAPGQAPVVTGSAMPLASRPIGYRYFAFPVTLTDNEQVFYLRVTSNYTLTVPLFAETMAYFQASKETDLSLQFLYYGAALALITYNLCLGLSLRDRRFLLYALFVFLLAGGVFSGNGLGRLYLWPDAPEFDTFSSPFLFALAVASGLQFSREFLRDALPAWTSFSLNGFSLIYLCIALAMMVSLSTDMPMSEIFRLFAIMVLPVAVLVIHAGLTALRTGTPGVRFFVLAWGILWSGATIAALRILDWVPSNVFTLYAMQLSSAIEMPLFSLALADIIRLERQRALQARSQTLEAQQRMYVATKASEERLEKLVAQRTAQLHKIIDQEKQTLAQYVRFGALISHEFRNPLAIIDSQATLLAKELATGHLEHPEKRLDIIKGATQRLARKFEKWLQGDRLNSQLSQLNRKRIPLHGWLRNIVASHPHFESQHTVTFVFGPGNPHVSADEELLEIAVINLIENACKYSPEGSTIKIETRILPGHIGIAVNDQGRGIPVERQGEIFSEYVRVQPESNISGLGLGLSLVKRIVMAHNGNIDLHSTPGRGSTFCLWFPRDETDRPHAKP